MSRSMRARMTAFLLSTATASAAVLMTASAASAATLCFDHLSNVQRPATQVGTENGEVIDALPNSVVVSLGGSDNVRTNGGAPKVVACLGAGNDIFSHSGTVPVAANFSVRGGDGSDVIFGGIGVDFLIGESGNDAIQGLDGNDIIQGNDGNDNINGNDGNDNINGGAGNDNIFGGRGNDVIVGGDGDNVIDGGDGVDTCTAPAGSNTTFKNCEVF